MMRVEFNPNLVLAIKRDVEGFAIKNAPLIRDNWKSLNLICSIGSKWDAEIESIKNSKLQQAVLMEEQAGRIQITH